jgi:hypothetical protein
VKTKQKIKDHIYVPNEIFKDIRENISSAKHNAFTYSYYYYVTYLYRYCEWYKDEKITQATIKQKLQKSPVEKKIDYIIKNNGILDTMGYTRTTSSYPISWTMENGFVEFMLIDDHRTLTGYKTIIQDLNYKVKYPVKSFFRNPDSEKDKILDGTFYEVENTHKINYEIFEQCMNNKDLGVNAFYIYGYIKYKQGGLKVCKIPSRSIKDEVLMSEPTFRKYVDELQRSGLVNIDRQKFAGENGIANGYSIAK